MDRLPMIRAFLHGDNGKPIVLLGLGEDNMARLRHGEPIRVNLRHLDPTGQGVTELPDVDVVIAFDDGSMTPALLAHAQFVAEPAERPPTQRRGWPAPFRPPEQRFGE